jgi:hypothetical protein
MGAGGCCAIAVPASVNTQPAIIARKIVFLIALLLFAVSAFKFANTCPVGKFPKVKSAQNTAP